MTPSSSLILATISLILLVTMTTTSTGFVVLYPNGNCSASAGTQLDDGGCYDGKFEDYSGKMSASWWETTPTTASLDQDCGPGKVYEIVMFNVTECAEIGGSLLLDGHMYSYYSFDGSAGL